MAQIFFQRGALARAIEQQRLAVNLIPESATKLRQKYSERLEKYEKAAREAPPVAKPNPPSTPSTGSESTPPAELQ
jgi:hypothetical protein